MDLMTVSHLLWSNPSFYTIYDWTMIAISIGVVSRLSVARSLAIRDIDGTRDSQQQLE